MLCSIHQVEFKEIPAGVSRKTGKPYNAFMACPEKGCRETFNPKDSTERGTKKVASAQGNSTRNYAKNQAAREDGMAFLNASRGAVEIVVAKIKIQMVSQIDGIQKPLEDKFIRDEVMKWTAFLYEMNTGKKVELKKKELKDFKEESNESFADHLEGIKNDGNIQF